MAKNGSYKETCDKLLKSTENSKRYSKGDYVELTTSLLNEKDHEVSYFTNPSGDQAVAVTKDPVKAYRESLKPVLSEFGVDKSEQEKIMDYEFSKKQAEALIDVAQVAQHDYLATGKKLRLPQLAANETTVTLERQTLPEKVESTNKIVDGKSVPTGKTIKTGERVATKAGNKVPAWLKTEVK